MATEKKISQRASKLQQAAKAEKIKPALASTPEEVQPIVVNQ
ncbi:hypothetical protein [Scytonema sp. NUACC26]